MKCEWTDLQERWHCENQASQMMSYGCVHEHVRTSATCQRCLDYARATGLICLRCWQHDTTPHHCEMRIVTVSVIQSENGNKRKEESASPGAEALGVQR